MTSEAERIAAGLSEAQKRALKSARHIPETSKYSLLGWSDGGQLVQSIKDLGLLNGPFLNRKAMAVRKVLETDNAQ